MKHFFCSSLIFNSPLGIFKGKVFEVKIWSQNPEEKELGVS